MVARIKMALMLNEVQKVPYYRILSEIYPFELLFFAPRSINWKSGVISGLRLKNGYWEEGNYLFPKTVYNRCYPHGEETVLRLGDVLGANTIFNSVTQFDKWDLYRYLAANETLLEHLPKTYAYTQGNSLGYLLQKRKEIILKPRRGFGGLGVLKINKISSDLFTISSHITKGPVPIVGEKFALFFLILLAPPAQFIAQQYIQSLERKGRKFDVRILMQKNLKGEWVVGGALSRISPAKSLLTNDYLRIVDPLLVVEKPLLTRLESLSRLTAKHLNQYFDNLGEIGVDFLIGRGQKPWILEVNGKPDKSLFWQLGNKKMLERIYLNPLNYQRYLQTKKAPGRPGA